MVITSTTKRRVVLIFLLVLVLPSCKHRSAAEFIVKVAELLNQWADQGVNSLRIYENINRAELSSILDVAHKRGLKVTGHLCAVGFVEAAQAGIDNLEHGLAVDTEFFSRKKPDECPNRDDWLPELARLDVKSEPVHRMIGELVSRRVAVTSTLAIFESFEGQFEMDPRTIRGS